MSQANQVEMSFRTKSRNSRQQEASKCKPSSSAAPPHEKPFFEVADKNTRTSISSRNRASVGVNDQTNLAAFAQHEPMPRPVTRNSGKKGFDTSLLKFPNRRKTTYSDKTNAVEWHCSALHLAYLKNMELLVDGGDSKLLRGLVLDKTHAELRALVHSHDTDAEPDSTNKELPNVMALLRALWDELQVPNEMRFVGLYQEQNGILCCDGDIKQGPLMLEAGAVKLEAVARHTRALLAYHDATLEIIHGLEEHERLLPLAVKEAGNSTKDNPQLTQLSKIDESLVQSIKAWCHRFADPPWLKNVDSNQSSDPGKHAKFLWQGIDTLQQIQADDAALLPQRVAEGNALQAWDPKHSSSEIVSASPSPRKHRRGLPQHCANRATLTDSRGLRAYLRSGENSYGIHAGLSNASTTRKQGWDHPTWLSLEEEVLTS